MAVVISFNSSSTPILLQSRATALNCKIGNQVCSFCISNIKTPRAGHHRNRTLFLINKLEDADPSQNNSNKRDEQVTNVGVEAALSMLKFYKREISPLLPKSCRYVPTCSEYSMEAYKKYGVLKGTILTAWRLCRCNPLGGSGFDPPRWFDEEIPREDFDD